MKTLLKILFGVAVFLAVSHTTEWFLVRKKVAEEAGIPKKEALPQCMLRGFLWWKPLREELEA